MKKTRSLTIPTIAITGSSGKTTTREFISSILETKWKILKTIGNKNLPYHTRDTMKKLRPFHQAILFELGMGQPGAGKKHCQHFLPNISVITNIGSAHYGNLGNHITSTAKNKSALIKYMDPKGTLLLNKDDRNSKYLDTKDFKGKLITIGSKNEADYCAKDIEYTEQGMKFRVKLAQKEERFFIPAFGIHNVYNALYAIAIADHLQFSVADIRDGLRKYKVPYKRLNFVPLRNQATLIDDSVNANPQSVMAAIDVMSDMEKEKKKIVVLGDMLELGEHTREGHKEVGRYLAKKKMDTIYTYGQKAKWIGIGAVSAGFPATHIKHFNDRPALHHALEKEVDNNHLILVKGSSLMNMNETASHLCNHYLYSVSIDPDLSPGLIKLNQQTFTRLQLEDNHITLRFGAVSKKLMVQIDPRLKLGKMVISNQLTPQFTIPNLPYDCYIKNNELVVGPVIGLLVLPKYMRDPQQQLARFAHYHQIKGLIYLFKLSTVHKQKEMVSGFYYHPTKKTFVQGTFPYPSVIFNRVPMKKKTYQHFKKSKVTHIFNYPYGNTNKWTFWKQISEQPTIKKHLPHTKEYKNIQSVLNMLKKHSSIYLKPATMAGGNGIFRIRYRRKGYQLSDHLGQHHRVTSEEALASLIKKQLVSGKKYILQQEITLPSLPHKIDFRLYLQKDRSRRWRFSGMETKVAEKGSVITNSQNRKKIIPGHTALMEIYQLTDKQATRKIKEITKVCIEILTTMERNGRKIGDAAIDLVMNKDHSFWILETQFNYAAEIKQDRTEDEKQVLPAILPIPFEYARALAGFL
ncbi:YheC/YheD family protein [Caldalkalibacillus mannanilyticus]|uniref:YheC/YheD family protein n=1 Tax=Caldalkalibacillus mannanilyticus TaxID=1418 RepID=UPI0004699F6B|nr:YheC/YheD family protein [Caldalkalibacillus mannanilyticus]